MTRVNLARNDHGDRYVARRTQRLIALAAWRRSPDYSAREEARMLSLVHGQRKGRLYAHV